MSNFKNLQFAGIYQIKHKESGKIYVGRSKNIAQRLSQHVYLMGCPKIDMALKREGWGSFDVSVLEKVSNVSLLAERELYWIEVLNADDPDIGYNMQPRSRNDPRKLISNNRLARVAKSVSLREETIAGIEKWAAVHDRSFSYEIDLAAARLVRYYEEMNDEPKKPDNPRRDS